MPATPRNWRKSSHSSGEHGDCVEAGSADGMVAVRDTAAREAGAVAFPTAAFAALLSAARADALDL